MRCLWLTLADPDPPTNGQFIYSGGLIEAIGSGGIELHVVGLARRGLRHSDRPRPPKIRWWLAEDEPRSRWAALFSSLPHMAMHTKTPGLAHLLRRCLERQRWDLIVFDSINLGWALPMVLRLYQGPPPHPKLVLVSHNHEEAIAATLAREEPRLLHRCVKYVDALKVARLERAVTSKAEIVFADAPDVCAAFRRQWPDKPIEFLPPGYGGQHAPPRRITAAVPRRAVIVGSFDWAAKRASLEAFLKVADPLFAGAGIELLVVGSAAESYLRYLRPLVTATRFTGKVPDILPYLAEARVALVPDRVGGFKLKSLDYVFNRIPILAIEGSVPGLPLCRDESIRLFPDHDALARGVVAAIDDLGALNGLQERAYAASRDQFDWKHIGKFFIERLSAFGALATGQRDPSQSLHRWHAEGGELSGVHTARTPTAPRI